MNNRNYLLTGIPRSGTTLCCKLLNGLENVTALHEPINPQKLGSLSHGSVATEIQQKIIELRISLLNEQAFEHGDKRGVDLDNPVGIATDVNKIRKQVAKRGMTKLSKKDPSFHLVVKQNAMFAATATDLSKHFKMVAIVRNPIKVLLSWMTVDLPVNKGRLPAGEKYDPTLAERLKHGDVLERQVIIYNWFIDQYLKANIAILKYEDILTSGGRHLFEEYGFEHTNENSALTEPNRCYAKHTIDLLFKNIDILSTKLSTHFYSRKEIIDTMNLFDIDEEFL